MDIWHYYNIEEFVDDIIELANRGSTNVSVFAKYNEARFIVRELLRYENAIIDDIEIQNEDYGEYIDEYLIEVWAEENDLYVSCIPAKADGSYTEFVGDTAYIFGNCNSKILKSCDYDKMYEISIDGRESLREKVKEFCRIFGI